MTRQKQRGSDEPLGQSGVAGESAGAVVLALSAKDAKQVVAAVREWHGSTVMVDAKWNYWATLIDVMERKIAKADDA